MRTLAEDFNRTRRAYSEVVSPSAAAAASTCPQPSSSMRKYRIAFENEERVYSPEERERRLQHGRQYRKENIEKARAREADYNRRKRAEDPIGQAAKQAAYYAANQTKCKEQQLRHRQKQTATIPHILRKQRRLYHQQRYDSDPQYRISFNCRKRMRSVFAHQSAVKIASTFTLIGCTGAELVAHLVSQFTEGMTLDNYGWRRGCWVIDHIVPVSSFDMSDPTQQRACFHFTNLQPLWSHHNLSKGAKLNWTP